MSTPRPLIGLTTSEMRNPVRDEELPHAEAGREEMVLNFHYMRGVTRAGGLPVVMSPQPLEAVPDLVGRLDGLLIPGGPDIDPATYGDEPSAPLGPLFPEIDRFEIACIHEAERRGLPILAICRGMQLLNVARGGTLHQHVPDLVGHEDHRRVPGEFGDHDVRLQQGSLAARAAGGLRVPTKSHHHQAIDELGDGLRITGWSVLDDLPEAIELPDAPFALGVLWHPEEDERSRVIGALVDAARVGAPR